MRKRTVLTDKIFQLCDCVYTATKAMQFQPSPEVPALQYVGSVEQGGAAAEAGLMSGDFIIEVSGWLHSLAVYLFFNT